MSKHPPASVPPASARQPYLRRQTAISALINMAISALFFLGLFRGQDPIPVWGLRGLAFDGLPQAFFVGLMSALAPALVSASLARKGVLPFAAAPRPTAAIVGAALAAGVISAGLGGGGAAFLLMAIGPDQVGFAAALTAKVLFGAALGIAVTPIMLVWALPRPSARAA